MNVAVCCGLHLNLALRIVPGSTSTRAVIVTKNVIFGLKWMFNLAAWDSSADPAWGNRFGQFDMAHVVVRPDGELYPQRGGSAPGPRVTG